ncbi:MAG TPA: PAS domain-containing protein, partial [Thermoanaerobaculia bacterium]|nr:PAS domain-containing protein [Thermoanaerobaculia bacterium]
MTPESLNQPALLERRRVGAFRQTLDGKLVECNESCAAILGYDSAEELVRLRGFEYFTESDPATIAAAIRDLETINNVDVCL